MDEVAAKDQMVWRMRQEHQATELTNNMAGLRKASSKGPIEALKIRRSLGVVAEVGRCLVTGHYQRYGR
jgi:hypothetical protein